MVYFNFEEALHSQHVSDTTPCEYCGKLIQPDSGAFFDDVTGHDYCSIECGSSYLKHNTPNV